jgi:hypothetical protein
MKLRKSAVGWALVGPIGILAGAAGRKAVLLGCMSCGHRWEPALQHSGSRIGCLGAVAIAFVAYVIFAGIVDSCSDRPPRAAAVPVAAPAPDPIPEVAVSALPVVKKRVAPKATAKPSVSVPTTEELLRELGADAH